VTPDPSGLAADLLKDAVERIRQNRRFPESTYRVQFHDGFTFRDAAAIVPYLAELGVTHLYASPYLRATPGSMHGYDVIDHGRLNPELGTQEDFDSLLAALRDHGMSHILDIVPNHMGVGTNDNPWWNDVLENGPASRYASYFDINWNAASPQSDHAGRVLLPCLGSIYGEVLEKGELKLGFNHGVFHVAYYERRFPISPKTYGLIFSDQTDLPAPLQALLQECDRLPDRCEGASAAGERHEAIRTIKQRLQSLSEEHTVRAAINNELRLIDGQPGDVSRADIGWVGHDQIKSTR